MNKVSVSTVTYNSDLVKLRSAIESLQSLSYIEIVILENSSNTILDLKYKNVKVINSKKNLGFGNGHNQVIFNHSKESKYHLILNPDVYFDPIELEKLINYMNANPTVSIVVPKVLYPNNKLQYSLRLIPTFFDQLIRRLNIYKNRIHFNELRFTKYEKEMFVPFPLGCFLLCRSDLLRKIGGFDPRFFLYMEDLDLCRRMAEYGEVKFYPSAQVYHHYEKGSTKKLKLLKYHIISIIKYYNKWGWINDKKRKELNDKCLNQFN